MGGYTNSNKSVSLLGEIDMTVEDVSRLMSGLNVHCSTTFGMSVWKQRFYCDCTASERIHSDGLTCIMASLEAFVRSRLVPCCDCFVAGVLRYTSSKIHE